MLRVLLVLEDYGEMVFLQILLHKLGFDVDTIKNPKALVNELYKMRPEVVVLTAKGKRVNGLDLSLQIKKVAPKTSLLLVAPSHVRDTLTAADMQHSAGILVSPVNPREFIETLAKLKGLDANMLLDKYKRMKSQIDGSAPDSNKVRGDQNRAPEEILHVNAPLKRNYEKFLVLDEPPPQKSFSKSKMNALVKKLRQEPLDPDLDKERQDFVKALFKKKTG